MECAMKKYIFIIVPTILILCTWALPARAACVGGVWNGIVEAGEECDINILPNPCPSGKACKPDCTCDNIEPDGTTCNDGMWSPVEDCDPAAPLAVQRNMCSITRNMPVNAQHFECRSNCECYYCGDNHKRIPIEECEPPGSSSDCPGSDVCNYSCECVASGCGNGIVEAGEECDPPNSTVGASQPDCASDEYCSSTCTCLQSQNVGGVCGNTVVDGNELCDYTAPESTWLCQPPALTPPPPVYSWDCTNLCECVMIVPSCGNDQLDAGEQCDIDINNNPIYDTNNPACQPGPGQTLDGCNPNTCICLVSSSTGVAVCGDGITDATEDCDYNATQAEIAVDCNDGDPSTQDICTTACTCAPTQMPGLCGNMIVDPGEQCDVINPSDPMLNACPEGQVCDIDCQCVDIPDEEECPNCCEECTCPPNCPETPGDEVPLALKACSIKVSGASTPASWDSFKVQNEAIYEIFKDTPMAGNDLFGEAGYSIVTFTLTMEDTVEVASDGKTTIAPWALIQLSGAPPVDFLKEGFQPAKKVYISTPTRIFPLDQADLSAMSLKASQVGLEAPLKTVVLPDMSAGLANLSSGLGVVQVDSVLTALGSENVRIQAATDTQWKLNNAVSLELVPSVSSAKASGGSTANVTVVGKVMLEPDRASWTGVEGGPVLMEGEKIEDLYIENRKLGPKAAMAVMSQLEQKVAALKAAGEPVDCRVLLGLDWEENLNYQYAFIQDDKSDALGILASPSGVGLGGGGCRCDMTAAMPAASQLALLIGLGATGLGALIGVRKRKRR